MLLVVSVGCHATRRALALADVGDLTADRVARQLHRVLPGLPRLHSLDQLAFVALRNAVGRKQHVDAGQFEPMQIIAGFVGAAAREAADVVTENRVEVAAVLGPFDHTIEVVPAARARTRDRVVHVPAQDAIAMVCGPSFDMGLLVGDRAFLHVGTAAGIGNGGNQVLLRHGCVLRKRRTPPGPSGPDGLRLGVGSGQGELPARDLLEPRGLTFAQVAQNRCMQRGVGRRTAGARP